MIERLPCKPAPTSTRPLIEFLSICLILALILYVAGV